MDTIQRRVRFAKGEQRAFIQAAIGQASLKEFCRANAAKMNVKYSTLKGYFREKQTLPHSLFLFLANCGNLQISDFNYEIIKGNWWQSNAGKRGAASLLRKYGREELNKRRARGGRNSAKTWEKTSIAVNEEVAELVGAYLGDGTITKYFMRIFGDRRYDIPYFEYLNGLVRRNFLLGGKIRAPKRGNLCYLEVSSREFCNYFSGEFSIKFGDKIRNRATIPKQIAENDSMLRACIRGLIDTDGSVSKDNSTISIRFDSHNAALLGQLEELNGKMKIFTFRNAHQLGTKSASAMERYFRLVGSSNMRHIIRYEEYLLGNVLRKHETLGYYGKYAGIGLPHRPARNSFNNLQANHINA